MNNNAFFINRLRAPLEFLFKAGISWMRFQKFFILSGFLFAVWTFFPMILQAAELSKSEASSNIYLSMVSNDQQAQPLSVPTDEPNRGLIYDHLRGVTKGVCAGMFQIEGTNYCTHGPDIPPPGIDIKTSAAPLAFAAGIQAASIQCDGDGKTGNRVQVVYVRAADQPDRFEEFRQSIQQWSAEVDEIYNESARETGGTRHIRFVHNSECQAEIVNVVIAANADDTFAGSISALQAMGHNRTDRKYLMFVDANIFCGIGGMYSDESPEATNRNNIGPTYARVDSGCWGSRVAAHELMHNFGGVQFGAPNSSGGYHCTDDWDVMCYSDAPLRPQVTIRCPDQAHESRLDCNHDDYYHTNPPAGSYLATHWNPAFNQFLIWENQPTPTPTVAATPTPAVAPNCIAYRANALPVSIFDQDTAISTLTIPENFVLTDVNLINLQIQHTFVADLEAYLVSPSGTKLLLFRGVGVNNRDFQGTWLDDEAATLINDGLPPFTGTYRPALPLTVFDGENSAGEWQLQITDTAFRDAGILNAWGLELCRAFLPVPTQTPVSTDIPSGQATPTPTPTDLPPRESSVQLDIVLNVEPKSIQNFRFEINGQTILLDDAPQEDGDPYSNRFTAFLTAGQYIVSGKVPHTWFHHEIHCSKDVEIDHEAADPTAILNLAAGDKVTCTFHNQRNVIVRTQTYEDINQSQQFDPNESWLAKWHVKLYSAENELLQTLESNQFGKANFNGLKAGQYQVCEVITDGWMASTPSRTNQQTASTCFDAQLLPGQIAIARFGNVRINNSNDGSENARLLNINNGLEISMIPDVTDDSAGYGDEILEDLDANTPVQSWSIFLPVVTK